MKIEIEIEIETEPSQTEKNEQAPVERRGQYENKNKQMDRQWREKSAFWQCPHRHSRERSSLYSHFD